MTDAVPLDPFRDEISSYAHHCKRLMNDLNSILEDYNEAAEINYAVDFSEIYAYVLPDDSHERAPFDDGWAGDGLRQTLFLSNFFNRNRGKIVLPEPYGLELHLFFDRVAVGTFGEELQLFIEAYAQLQRLKRLADLDRIKKLARQAERRDLMPDEIKEALEFFETRGSLLIAFARGANREPLQRMRELLKSRPFVSLDTVAPDAPAATDPDVVEDMFQRLVIRRRSGTPANSSKVDALAIDHIRAANCVLHPQKRLLLVTRSEHMMAALHDAAGNPAWADIKPFIRHPRTFSMAYDLAMVKDREAIIRRIQLRKQMLDLFIGAVVDAQQGKGITTDHREELRKKMRAIQEEWSSGEQLANALKEGREKSGGEDAKLAKTLLAFLRGNAMMDTARQRVMDIFDETARDIGMIGARVQTPEATLGSVLYPIEFANETLRNRVAGLARRWKIYPQDAASMFDDAAKVPLSNHEFLLVISVTLGANGRWSVAEQYAAQAVNLADSKLATAEARLVHALTLRKLSSKTDEERRQHLWDAQNEITLALAERPNDPRYLNENGVIAAMQLNPRMAFEEFHAAREAVASLFERARLVDHSEKLEIQILNNLAYLYYSIDPIKKDLAQMYLRALEHQLRASGDPRAEWPSYVVDTIIYGRYCLECETVPLPTLVAWIEELKPVAEARDLTQEEQSQIRQHVKTMNERRVKLEGTVTQSSQVRKQNRTPHV